MMADGLARLLAPILPMTADELWRYLPGPRDESVHLASFPAADVDALLEPALSERWERLMTIRDEVNRALETERRHKTIGNSLGARVMLSAGGDRCRAARAVPDELPMLFIVSEVELAADRRRGRRREHRGGSTREGEKCPSAAGGSCPRSRPSRHRTGCAIVCRRASDATERRDCAGS